MNIRSKSFVWLFFIVTLFKVNSSDDGSVPGKYGEWMSSLTAHQVSLATPTFMEGPIVDPITGIVFWIESNLNNINVVKSYNPDLQSIDTWTTDNWNIKTQINGHGGGSIVVYDNTIFFTNWNDNLLYILKEPKGIPIPITSNPLKNYADGCYSASHNVLIYVMENMEEAVFGKQHSLITQHMVAINLTTGNEMMLPMSAEFFGAPRISPSFTKLAWLEWDYPNLPWDETKLVTTSLESDGHFQYLKYIQHGSMSEPKWNQHNELLYIHDGSNWSNLYINNKRNYEVNLTPVSRDVRKSTWRLGRSTYDVNPAIGKYEAVIAIENTLYEINTRNQKNKTLSVSEYDVIHSPVYSFDGKKIFFLAANSSKKIGLTEYDVATGVIRRLYDVISPKVLLHDLGGKNASRLIQFITTDNDTAFGIFYDPNNKGYHASNGSKPPAIIIMQTGPHVEFDLEIPFFTSRGFAVLDLHQRGTSGYGKKYQEKIYETWGKYDVADAVGASRYLVKSGLVDSDRIALKGFSYSAYAVIKALKYHNIFKAGVICSGLTDVVEFYNEARSMDKIFIEKLLGEEEIASLASGLGTDNRTEESITEPILLIHGSDDEFLDPLQSIEFYQELLRNGTPTSLELIEGADHYLLGNKSLEKTLEAELRFYGDVFRLSLPEPATPK